MEIGFVPAKVLKTAYKVFGHFYSIELGSGRTVQCRSTLEIVSIPLSKDPAALVNKQADAIFIMMNPGSSQPLQGLENSISEAHIRNLQIELVPAKPDTTQYQLMRLMRHFGWTHVRVLNLSDLREPKSSLFFDRYKELESDGACRIHSVFSDARGRELGRQLNRARNAPIVCAWGVSSDLSPLIERCMSRIQGQDGLLGLLKQGTADKYYHPHPTLQADREKWVTEMIQLLSAYRLSLAAAAICPDHRASTGAHK